MLLLSRWALAFYSALILCLSLLNVNSISLEVNLWDKANHFIAYAVFAMIAAFASKHRKQYCILLLLIFFFGIAIEGLQSLNPYRTASFFDIIANALGLFAAYCVHAICRYLKIEKHKHQA